MGKWELVECFNSHSTFSPCGSGSNIRVETLKQKKLRVNFAVDNKQQCHKKYKITRSLAHKHKCI